MKKLTCKDCRYLRDEDNRPVCAFDERRHECTEEFCGLFRDINGKRPRFLCLCGNVDVMAEALAHADFFKLSNKVERRGCLMILDDKEAIKAAKKWLMELV